MKSKDTLKWFPAQLPEVRIILGDAVVEVAKQGSLSIPEHCLITLKET
ncbi:hypothetical protein BANRA_02338 [Escherichia coli]|nr:hypothetical protein BANRA_02338 [Escherichia coli]